MVEPVIIAADDATIAARLHLIEGPVVGRDIVEERCPPAGDDEVQDLVNLGREIGHPARAVRRVGGDRPTSGEIIVAADAG